MKKLSSFLWLFVALLLASSMLLIAMATPAFADNQVLLLGDSLLDDPIRPGVSGDVDQTGSFDNSVARGVYPCDGTSPGTRYIMGPAMPGASPDIHFIPPGKSHLPYYLLTRLQQL